MRCRTAHPRLRRSRSPLYRPRSLGCVVAAGSADDGCPSRPGRHAAPSHPSSVHGPHGQSLHQLRILRARCRARCGVGRDDRHRKARRLVRHRLPEPGSGAGTAGPATDDGGVRRTDRGDSLGVTRRQIRVQEHSGAQGKALLRTGSALHARTDQRDGRGHRSQGPACLRRLRRIATHPSLTSNHRHGPGQVTLRFVTTPLAPVTDFPSPRENGFDPVLADALVPSPAREAALERLHQPDAFVLTSGQQPGLFTGPLYTVYKALSTAGLARVLERQWQRPVVPMFWIAGDDHDFAEASRASWITADGTVRTAQLSPRANDAPLTPMYREPLRSGITT